MIVNQGITVLAISFDAKPPAVMVEGPDGAVQICPVKKWFAAGDPPREVTSHLTADTATIEVLGQDEHGYAAQSRYDVKLHGIGPPIHRNADGSFGEKAGKRLEQRLARDGARLPGVFDKEGMS